MTEELKKYFAKRIAADSRTDRPARVLLSEGDDERVQKAAQNLNHYEGVEAKVLLAKNVETPHSIPIEKHPALDGYAQALFEKRKKKGMSLEQAKELCKTPLYFAALHADIAETDAVISGATHTTADVIRAGYHVLGKAPGTNTLTSTFLMILEDGTLLTYADCGVVPQPTASQLADIALEAASTHVKLTEQESRVAMLSFSSKGSAEHPSVNLVREALEIAQGKQPSLKIDGELQFDAAFVPEVAKRKAPDSDVAGRANVFVFPNLDAGNIAYKITERIGRATAVGPILRGFSRPWMDLSRGCKAEDIELAALIALMLR